MIYVQGFNGNTLGSARNFVQAKHMQLATVPEDLRPYYGGIGTEGQLLFYEMPDELLAKYPQLARRA